MNIIEKENSDLVNKIINIINDEFSPLSYKTISTQIKTLPPSDVKQHKLFLVAYAKTVEKTKLSTINQIKRLNESNRKCNFNYLSNMSSYNDLKLNWFSPSNYAKPAKSAGAFSKEKLNTSNKSYLLKLDRSLNSIFSNHDESNSSTNGNVDNSIMTKSKSAKKIFKSEQNYNCDLAKDVVEFIDDMKMLQCSICKKEPNVNIMKKNFEKKKVMLYQDAMKLITKPSSPKAKMVSKETSATSSSNNVLSETITLLKAAIDDIKSNSKFITEQLRLEIKTLNDKVASQSASITQYENNLIKHVTAMKSLYKIIKDTTPLNTMPIQTVSSSLEDKFDWYEEEIQRAISVILSHKENSNEDHIEISKVHEMIKVYANDILHIIRPYITEEESEIDLKVFDDKENFEESLIVSAIEALKKHIKRICEMVSEAKKKNEKVSKDFSEMKVKMETYKTLLENTVNKMTHNKKPSDDYSTISNASNKANIAISDNGNNIATDYESVESLKKINNELVAIQNDLIQKLEIKDIENEKNKETIASLLQMKKGKNDTEVVSSEKYHYLLNLYSTEQDKFKQLRYDYFHLIQELSSFIENGDKIKIDLSRVNVNNTTNNGYIDEEIDSTELGRINENDLLTDKEKDIFNHRMNSRDSRGSNCNSFNRYNNNKNSFDKKQIQSLKIELKITKSELEKMNKKLNDVNGVITMISNAVNKLLNEVQVTNQVKEYFTLIFRLLSYSEEKIASIFNEREKRKVSDNY